MANVVNMPKLSDTMEEGGIAQWLKKEGDAVDEGEPLLEIETDKATMEYTSPEEGVLLKILVQPGTSVPLQTPIAVIGQKGESFSLEQLTGSSATVPPSEKPTTKSPEPSALQVVAPKEETSHGGGQTGRLRASPLAKKVAKDKGINLSTVTGTGPLGRVIVRDLEQAPAAVAVAAPQATSLTTKMPLTQMRKTIAKRLLQAKNDAPHFYLTASANMEAILAWRSDLNGDKRVQAGEWAKISVNDLLLLVCSKALLRHPAINSSWQHDHILQHHGVHMAMAVALESGLVTPVLFNCDSKGIREIAALAKQLGKKARDGALTPDEYQGGTFTISNLGMTCVEEFTAIINPPQACILAVGRTQQVPYVSASGTIVAQHRMKMTLSCDHRVVDGMVGAQFLQTLVDYLENPLKILS